MTSILDPSIRRILGVVSIGAATIALAGCSLLGGNTATEQEPASTGASTDVFEVKVGDCISDEVAEGEISEVPTVDCAQLHIGEAFAESVMAVGEFPGEDAVDAQAVSACTAEFLTFVGLDYETSELDFSYLFPTEASWANDDRQIVCIIVDPAGPVTGTLEGAAR